MKPHESQDSNSRFEKTYGENHGQKCLSSSKTKVLRFFSACKQGFENLLLKFRDQNSNVVRQIGVGLFLTLLISSFLFVGGMFLLFVLLAMAVSHLIRMLFSPKKNSLFR
ncbi:MAG: hypothetical protein KDD52_05390 [Bdellovibrionales bacterium]|nr:hypothetical protein [Bdellovibrionales bacterium]